VSTVRDLLMEARGWLGAFECGDPKGQWSLGLLRRIDAALERDRVHVARHEDPPRLPPGESREYLVRDCHGEVWVAEWLDGEAWVVDGLLRDPGYVVAWRELPPMEFE